MFKLAALSVAAIFVGNVFAFTGKGAGPRAALPIGLFPNGEHCCETVEVTYEDKSIEVTFTDLYLYCQATTNLSLSHEVFAELASLELGSIYPVFWRLL
ncbi:hypothetical protein B0H17DRAFT_1191528 [Mycena rosella]|uniref:Uncharacterized protein n=1 Tax=Mycena rosella TaxID=1033263 RepID=A0AAD7GZZ6_MYCRO|nr:hypothetical protein B0H17DRAFT_1191528 [Mycena rosella]